MLFDELTSVRSLLTEAPLPWPPTVVLLGTWIRDRALWLTPRVAPGTQTSDEMTTDSRAFCASPVKRQLELVRLPYPAFDGPRYSLILSVTEVGNLSSQVPV